VHDTLPELFETRFGERGAGLLRLEERLSAAAADVVITVTEEAKARLAARGVGVDRTVVVMNSPDERVFGPPRPPARIPDAGEVRAIYHGGLPARFGVEALIRAAGALGDRVPRLRLSVLGSGDERDALASLAAGVAPGRVTVAPRPVAFTEIPAHLEAAHIGVVPTLSDAFTNLLLPVKLLEYVHMGVPVVSSRLNGIERYFTDREVRFAEPGSPASFADALAELCADPQAAATRAARAAERLRALGWAEQRRSYLDTVDDLVSRRAPARRGLRWRAARPPLELRTPALRR
jgi:glycosyltransferase involved in cell wall biosynthesis